jgi:flagellar protein FliO/FliZ
MTSSITSIFAILLLLAFLPMGVKWIQRKMRTDSAIVAQASAFVSAVAVGPHQRVVTVEVGPRGDRTWLVLGVTAQSITLLHSVANVVDTARSESSAQA